MKQVLLLLVIPVSLLANSHSYPVPVEMRTDHFTMSLDGHPADVEHAATSYYFAAFDLIGQTRVSITAPTDGYWAAGVEVQPWRWGIRPSVSGRTISFTITEPGKFSISRPGDHGATAEMIFLFANTPDPAPPKPSDPHVRYYSPGVYHESIDAHTGDRIYLAPGAVIFGSINVWGVSGVRIWGRGTVVYDGPQDPNHDEGWMHKPNWHGIVMDHSRDIQIKGIIVLVRSRTWMIQLLSSRDLLFEDIKVIGGCPGNANQDGIDWLGGGHTTIRNSFFRASDDIFALYGNWLGYSQEALTTPGEDVSDILVEKCVLSTSISNVVRVSWPQKIFNSHNFVLRDSDIMHAGQGACKVPFALLEIWDDPGGHGSHSDYTFEDLRLEYWYSLLQLHQKLPVIHNISMSRIWSLGTPQLVSSVQQGNIEEIKVKDTNVTEGMGTAFTYSAGALLPGRAIQFHAAEEATNYLWIFGDGSTAVGREVEHIFPDADGTERNGSGRFRVILRTSDATGKLRWDARFVVLGISGATERSPGTLTAPKAGGYTFHLIANDMASLIIDNKEIARSPVPKPHVCGSAGNMAQVIVKSVLLTAGSHSITVQRSPEQADLALYWEGPGVPLTRLSITAASSSMESPR